MTKEKDHEYYCNSLEVYAGILQTAGNPNQRTQNKAIAGFLSETSLQIKDMAAELAIAYADQRSMVDELECSNNELEELKSENKTLQVELRELQDKFARLRTV